MNVTTLTKVAQSSRAADVVFKYLAGRERSSWSMNLGRVYNEIAAGGVNVSRDAFNKVFEDLHKAGAGAIVHGRRGGANRFIWNYNFRQAAEQTLKSIQAAKPAPKKNDAPAPTPHVIQLTLPASMSHDDIKALLELAKSFKS